MINYFLLTGRHGFKPFLSVYCMDLVISDCTTNEHFSGLSLHVLDGYVQSAKDLGGSSDQFSVWAAGIESLHIWLIASYT